MRFRYCLAAALITCVPVFGQATKHLRAVHARQGGLFTWMLKPRVSAYGGSTAISDRKLIPILLPTAGR